MLIKVFHININLDSGSTSSDARPTSSDNLPSDSPKSHHSSYSDTEEEKDWEENLLQRPQGDESSLPSVSSNLNHFHNYNKKNLAGTIRQQVSPIFLRILP